MTPKLEISQDMCTSNLPPKFHHPTLTRSETIVLINTLANPQTNKQTDSGKNIKRSLLCCEIGQKTGAKNKFFYISACKVHHMKTNTQHLLKTEQPAIQRQQETL